uniref:Uncharacterized protein n=1 Tax=Anguilla anguilla TaxID=7936 RepID=A0A0E9WUH9_ANGAN
MHQNLGNLMSHCILTNANPVVFQGDNTIFPITKRWRLPQFTDSHSNKKKPPPTLYSRNDQ